MKPSIFPFTFAFDFDFDDVDDEDDDEDLELVPINLILRNNFDMVMNIHFFILALFIGKKRFLLELESLFRIYALPFLIDFTC